MLPGFVAKLCPRAELLPRLAALARPIVFTNGVFGILHRGHVTYLAQARAEGASLVVGLNSDHSARLLGKAPDRPLNNEGDRATVLAALESVSRVTLFDESTPLELLKLIRPELYVKGGDSDVIRRELQKFRDDRVAGDAERQKLEEQVKKLMAELEKTKKK